VAPRCGRVDHHLTTDDHQTDWPARQTRAVDGLICPRNRIRNSLQLCQLECVWKVCRRVRATIGNETAPKILISNTINLFFETAISIWLISDHKSFRVLSEKSFPYILFDKYIDIFAHKMASPGNQHSASCIGTLSFPISSCSNSITLICWGCTVHLVVQQIPQQIEVMELA